MVLEFFVFIILVYLVVIWYVVFYKKLDLMIQENNKNLG